MRMVCQSNSERGKIFYDYLQIDMMKLNHWIVLCLVVKESQLENVQNVYQSLTKLADVGLEFSPVDFEGIFLLETTTQSWTSCVELCHWTVECRIFDYNDQLARCRLFEGNLATMGFIVSSSSASSRLGSIQLRPEDFKNEGQSCSYCKQSRNLICITDACQCRKHTYFDGSICQSQKLLGFNCSNNYECRLDLNYTCLSRGKCGRKYSLSNRGFNSDLNTNSKFSLFCKRLL